MRFETDLFATDIESRGDIAEAFANIDNQNNSRVILSTDAETYIQAGAYANGYVVEKRSGSEKTHMHARPRGRPPLSGPLEPERKWWQKLFRADIDLGSHAFAFTQEEVVAIFTTYFERARDPEFADWHEGYH